MADLTVESREFREQATARFNQLVTLTEYSEGLRGVEERCRAEISSLFT